MATFLNVITEHCRTWQDWIKDVHVAVADKQKLLRNALDDLSIAGPPFGAFRERLRVFRFNVWHRQGRSVEWSSSSRIAFGQGNRAEISWEWSMPFWACGWSSSMRKRMQSC